MIESVLKYVIIIINNKLKLGLIVYLILYSISCYSHLYVFLLMIQLEFQSIFII